MTASDDGGAKPRVYGVTELTRRIKTILEDRVGEVWLEGELSNIRRPSSGHYYFTIKDENAQIGGVLFRGSQRGLRCTPADGLQVRILGEVTVYERGGNYQVIVRRMEESGLGALQARFEELKKRLQAEGLFAEERKRAIPLLPQHIGVVTSPTGAAIRDILSVIDRRFPNVHITIAPARVQGEMAAGEIAAAIELLNRKGDFDVLIVGRGGGSLEDLWCFNEEIVARAIAASRIPVISAVGHEVDFTISDFVADLRAATPSAAAELVVGRKEELEERIRSLSVRLGRAVRQSSAEYRHRLAAVVGHFAFREPRNLVVQYAQRLDVFDTRLCQALRSGARQARERVRGCAVHSVHLLQMRRQSASGDVTRLVAQLRSLNPLAVLERGYSVTQDVGGRVIRSVKQASAGETVVTRVADGRFESTVIEGEQD